jgi:hypothetical protein
LYSFSSFILREYHADPMIEGETVSTRVEFFKVGHCCGKEYIVIMKLRNLESLIKGISMKN